MCSEIKRDVVFYLEEALDPNFRPNGYSFEIFIKRSGVEKTRSYLKKLEDSLGKVKEKLEEIPENSELFESDFFKDVKESIKKSVGYFKYFKKKCEEDLSKEEEKTIIGSVIEEKDSST